MTSLFGWFVLTSFRTHYIKHETVEVALWYLRSREVAKHQDFARGAHIGSICIVVQKVITSITVFLISWEKADVSDWKTRKKIALGQKERK